MNSDRASTSPARSWRADWTGSFGVGRPVSLGEGAGYFILAAVIDIGIGLRTFPSVLKGSLVNPDTYMRLVRLHDSLAQHALVHVVARDAGGSGTVLHWSHLIDGILLVLAAPLAIFRGENEALHSVALVFGPIALGLLAVAVAWAVAPFSAPRWRWLVPLLAAVSPAIVGFAVPGEVHHHIPVAAASVMTAGWALRSPSIGARAGWQLALWAAVGIWLTPESLPFILASFGGVGLFWLLHPENRNAGAALYCGGLGFLLFVTAALALDPPFGGYATVRIERLSVVYVGLGAVLCVVGWTLAHLDDRRLSPMRRGFVASLTALVAFALWFAAFPSVLEGPYGLLDKEATKLFFGAISDMQPIVTAPQIVSFLSDGVLAVAAAGAIAWRARSPVWGFAALCGGLTVALGCIHRRFATYPEIVAVAMLPIITSVIDGAPRRRSTILTIAPWAVVAIFLALPYLGGLFASPGLSKSHTATNVATCDPRELRDVLRPYAGQIVLSDPTDSPGLLYWTDVRTVASLFHLSVAAFIKARDAWRSMPSDAEPEAVRATNASLIVVCPRTVRSSLVADLPKTTLLDRLEAGTPPPWLQPIPSDPASGYRIYRIRSRPD